MYNAKTQQPRNKGPLHAIPSGSLYEGAGLLVELCGSNMRVSKTWLSSRYKRKCCRRSSEKPGKRDQHVLDNPPIFADIYDAMTLFSLYGACLCLPFLQLLSMPAKNLPGQSTLLSPFVFDNGPIWAFQITLQFAFGSLTDISSCRQTMDLQSLQTQDAKRLQETPTCNC